MSVLIYEFGGGDGCVGEGGEMNCSLLPQNENSDLALGRLTPAESYFQQWRRAKKQSLATPWARIQLSCFVGWFGCLRKAAVINLQALRLQVKWPHSQICQITWKHRGGDTLKTYFHKRCATPPESTLRVRLKPRKCQSPSQNNFPI